MNLQCWHSIQGTVNSEMGHLVRNGSLCGGLILYVQALLGFDGLMKTITPSSARQSSAGKLIDNDDLW